MTTTTNGTLHGLGPEYIDAARFLAKHWSGPLRENHRRHQAAGALAGGLLRAGLKVETVERFVEAVAEEAQDEEAGKRVGVVRPTDQKLKSKSGNVTGFPTLTQLLGDEGANIVRTLKVKLGLAITLDQLAADKALPIEYLCSLGLHDLPEGGVGIPYHDVAGKVLEVKIRTALKATEGSYWPKGKPLRAYGEDRLDAASAAGFQVIVEGESDSWTLWFHGFPALGLPGADTVKKTVELGHVGAVSKAYVFQEPNQSGEEFIRNVRQRLADLGWGGELRFVKLNGIKDPNDLHRQNPDVFRERFQEALDKAEPLTVPAAAKAPEYQPRPWPNPPAAEAYHGLAGEIVRAIEPASEADPAALLVQALIGFGNLIGRSAHFRVEADRHFGNEFIALVGRTAKARKGTSWGQIHRLLTAAEEFWAAERVQSGLSSGEGLIWSVRDPILKRERIKERGAEVRYEEVEADPGVADKRLLVYEPEFANVLKQTERQGNTLSVIIRQAWESGSLRSMTKNSPARASGAHVSIIGHITAEELRRYLSLTETANGFANRFMWICTQRSKQLPEGGRPDELVLRGLVERLGHVLTFARGIGEVGRDEQTRALWREVYGDLSADRPGLGGALLARGEAHVMRLALLYALLESSRLIQAPHLMAALAVWQYALDSVRYIFGDALGDPVADDLLRFLRAAGPDGATRTDIRDFFGRNRSSEQIGRALALLAEHGLARRLQRDTNGRPAECWAAV
jgi:hypothetical protein